MPLQNRQFGSKIKTLKNMLKTSLEPEQNCSMQNPLQKRPNIRKITNVLEWEKTAILHGL